MVKTIRAGNSLKNPFQKVNVQLVNLGEGLPEGGDWIWELKYDGYRIVAFAEGDSVRLITRGGMDYTKRFSAVADSINGWSKGRAFVLDGEMIVADENGRSDFSALQNFSSMPQTERLVFMVFDVLALDGQDLRGMELLERKKILKTLMKGAPSNIKQSIYRTGDALKLFDAVCSMNFEGLIGKLGNSTYMGKRNQTWIKYKCKNYRRRAGKEV